MKRKLFLLVILIFPISLLVGKEYTFQEYSLRIDIPETIRFRYYTPNEEKGISANSDIEIIIRIKPLNNYLHFSAHLNSPRYCSLNYPLNNVRIFL